MEEFFIGTVLKISFGNMFADGKHPGRELLVRSVAASPLTVERPAGPEATPKASPDEEGPVAFLRKQESKKKIKNNCGCPGIPRRTDTQFCQFLPRTDAPTSAA